jgi:peptide/nickel transport system ATP-binding protein
MGRHDCGVTPLLMLNDLRISVRTDEQGYVEAVSGLSLTLARGEALGLVGESGCGKTLTSLAILGLLPGPIVRQTGGDISFEGVSIKADDSRAFRALRGRRIGYVPQNPMSALNPVFTIGEQVIEAVRLHAKVKRRQARDMAVELLDQVGVPRPVERLRQYPHELSGGLRQRVLIAIALAGDPDLLVADEPTTALDVTIQAQVLRLLTKLQQDRALGLLLVTHDLGVVAQTCDRIAVLYAGRCVEQGDARHVLNDPRHPYTRGLLSSMPTSSGDAERRKGLRAITGQVPPLGNWPSGCRFRDRCPRAESLCAKDNPELTPLDLVPARDAACHFAEEPRGSTGPARGPHG